MKKITTIVVAVFSLTVAYAAGDAKAGKPVYDQRCKSCHGDTGIANPGIVKMMKVEIPALGSAPVQALSDDELKKVVTDGKNKMPPVKTVTGKSVDDVVAYVRTMKK